MTKRIHIVDVIFVDRVVELPDRCSMCGNDLSRDYAFNAEEVSPCFYERANLAFRDCPADDGLNATVDDYSDRDQLYEAGGLRALWCCVCGNGVAVGSIEYLRAIDALKKLSAEVM